jgi:2-methylcitrate dehydratase PrpD
VFNDSIEADPFGRTGSVRLIQCAVVRGYKRANYAVTQGQLSGKMAGRMVRHGTHALSLAAILEAGGPKGSRQAGEHEYTDDVVRSPEVIALRDLVELVVDRQIHEASVDVTIETTDGRSLHIFIERAIGSLEKPMTNELLKAKFVDQSAPILGADQAEQAWLACMGLADQPDLKTVLKSLSPV